MSQTISDAEVTRMITERVRLNREKAAASSDVHPMSSGYLRKDPLMHSGADGNPVDRKDEKQDKKKNKKKKKEPRPDKNFGALHVRGVHFGEDNQIGYVVPLRTVPYSYWDYVPASNTHLFTKRLQDRLTDSMKRVVLSKTDAERFNRSATVEDHRTAMELALDEISIIREHMHTHKHGKHTAAAVETKEVGALSTDAAAAAAATPVSIVPTAAPVPVLDPISSFRYVLGDCDNDGFQTGFQAAALSEMIEAAKHGQHTAWKGATAIRYIIGSPDEKVIERVLPFIHSEALKDLRLDASEIATSAEFRSAFKAEHKAGKIPKDSVIILNGLGSTNSSIDDDLFPHVLAASGFTRADSLYKIYDVDKRRQELKDQYGTDKFTPKQVDDHDMAFLVYDAQRHLSFKPVPPNSDDNKDPEIEFLRGVHDLDTHKELPKLGKFGRFDNTFMLLTTFKSPRLITQCVRMEAHSEHKQVTDDKDGKKTETTVRKVEERFSVDHSTGNGTTRREWIAWTVHPLNTSDGHTREDLFCSVVKAMLVKERARLDPTKGKDIIFTRDDTRAYIGRFGFLDLGYHRITTAHDEHGRRFIRKVRAGKETKGAIYGLYFRYPIDELESDNGSWKQLRDMVEASVHQEFKKAEARASLGVMEEALDKLDNVTPALKEAVRRVAEQIGPTAPAMKYRKYLQSRGIYTTKDIADFMSVLKDVRAKIRVDKADTAPDPADKKKKKNKKNKKKQTSNPSDQQAEPNRGRGRGNGSRGRRGRGRAGGRGRGRGNGQEPAKAE